MRITQFARISIHFLDKYSIMMHQGCLHFVFCLLAFSLTNTIKAQSTFDLSYRSEKAAPFVDCVVMQAKGDQSGFPELKVYLESVWKEQGHRAPHILGKQIDTLGMRVFQPLLAFRPGTRYLVKAGAEQTYVFEVPKATTNEPPSLLGIYPSTKRIPANQLKFYLLFDQPMRHGDAYQYLRLVAEDGSAEMPFLPLEPELWDSSGQRLTLWFDPGRLKRDLVLNQAQGAPLEAGRNYMLHIDQKWRAKNGLSLDQSYRHSIEVGDADRISPEPARWQIIPASAETKDPLKIQFGEALDYALAQTAIVVLDDHKQVVKGEVLLSKDQQEWEFIPLVPWAVGEYQIQIKGSLEDLAGNNLNRLFDTDLQEAKERTPQDFYFLSFYVRTK